jgi:hypothetical protein
MAKREIHSSAFLSGTCLALREAAGALSELSQRVIALRHAKLNDPEVILALARSHSPIVN